MLPAKGIFSKLPFFLSRARKHGLSFRSMFCFTAWENGQHFTTPPNYDVWEIDPSLFKSEWCFWLVLLNEKFSLTHQKHHPDLRSDVSSVWNFCTCFSDLILRQTRGGITKCRQILRPFASLSHIISFFSNLV